MIRKVYGKIWKHGGEFEAPPGEITQVMCRKTGGVFVLNTVCVYLLSPPLPHPLSLCVYVCENKGKKVEVEK